MGLLPEQLARVKIDKQLTDAGWEIVTRDEFVATRTQAVKEALMLGTKECDYLLFVDGKAIAVVEAKREENDLGEIVAKQAENYSKFPKLMYGFWFDNPKMVPLVYLANGKKIYFKNMLFPDSEYVEIDKMHSPKKMLKLIGKTSTYGALPRIERKGLRDCQYEAEVSFEDSLKLGKNKSLCMLATGSGKTYLACLASYRLLNYTSVDRVLFLVDRNNLAKQTENEFNTFDRTENGQTLSYLYNIKRLKTNDDVKGDVVISTIQKLFAVLTGNNIIDDEADECDDFFKEECDEPEIELGDNLKLPPDYFKFIVIDECHRSIYGKWKSVLDYFSNAIVLGLTATPTEEAYAFFDKNMIEEYTYDDSVIDGVNVPFRVYDIETKATSHGGEIPGGTTVTEVSKKTGHKGTLTPGTTVIYSKDSLDKTVIDRNQIKEVLKAYRDSIYTDLYPDREAKWEYIPKTLIFAKNDKHADEIVEAIRIVFGEKFTDGQVPNEFVQKITYSAGDSTQLIKEFRINKNFRIAVTVTLVATGTDIRPLEVVFFMADVKSDVLYTQMKGRGCRTINDDKFKEVTPNASHKDCFYVVDAVGVTKSEKHIPRVNPSHKKNLCLKDLLEHLSHGELSDDNLALLRDYCASLTNKYKNHPLFHKHLDEFFDKFGFYPVYISEEIKKAFEDGSLPEYKNPSEPNIERKGLISKLLLDPEARAKLLELKKGYVVFAPDSPDELIYKGFSIEEAKKFIENFEKCLMDHKDSIEALRIIYNSENKHITHSMLIDLRDKLLNLNRQYVPSFIWKNYQRIDNEGKVLELDLKRNVNALTNLIQIARYVYGKTNKLSSLYSVFAQRFNLYVGSTNHNLSQTQVEIMKKIAEYIVEDGYINSQELNDIDTDLWRKGITEFGPQLFISEMQMLSKFVLGAA